MWPPGVRWDRSVLRPNSSVSLSKSLLLTKPLFSCEENGSDGTCSRGGEMALFHLKGSIFHEWLHQCAESIPLSTDPGAVEFAL